MVTQARAAPRQSHLIQISGLTAWWSLKRVLHRASPISWSAAEMGPFTRPQAVACHSPHAASHLWPICWANSELTAGWLLTRVLPRTLTHLLGD